MLRWACWTTFSPATSIIRPQKCRCLLQASPAVPSALVYPWTDPRRSGSSCSKHRKTGSVCRESRMTLPRRDGGSTLHPRFSCRFSHLQASFPKNVWFENPGLLGFKELGGQIPTPTPRTLGRLIMPKSTAVTAEAKAPLRVGCLRDGRRHLPCRGTQGAEAVLL